VQGLPCRAFLGTQETTKRALLYSKEASPQTWPLFLYIRAHGYSLIKKAQNMSLAKAHRLLDCIAKLTPQITGKPTFVDLKRLRFNNICC